MVSTLVYYYANHAVFFKINTNVVVTLNSVTEEIDGVCACGLIACVYPHCFAPLCV